MSHNSHLADPNLQRNRQAAITMPAPTPPRRRLTVCVIGVGGEGENLAARIIGMGHKVARMPETPRSEEELHVHHNQLINLEPDVIIFATSTKNFRSAVTAFPPRIFEEVLVISYLPVMGLARNTFLTFLPESAGIITAGQIIGDWYQRPFCVDLFRIHAGKIKQCATEFLHVFENQECKISEISAESFDDSMANSQFLPFVIGKTLVECQFSPTTCDTESTEMLLQVTDAAFVSNKEIFYTIFRYNPSAKAALAALEQMFKKVRDGLEAYEEEQLSKRRREVADAVRRGNEDLFTSLFMRKP